MFPLQRQRGEPDAPQIHLETQIAMAAVDLPSKATLIALVKPIGRTGIPKANGLLVTATKALEPRTAIEQLRLEIKLNQSNPRSPN